MGSISGSSTSGVEMVDTCDNTISTFGWGGGSDRGGLMMSDGDEGVDLHIYTVATSSAVDKKPGITLKKNKKCNNDS